MTTSPLARVIQHLHRSTRSGAGRSDGQLLDAFVERREEAAFAGLVERHGAMVFGVCQRVLGNAQDAEDAFQATFLVLARKADSVRPRELVGNWLYGVACRTALEARGVNTRHRMRERQMHMMPEPEAAPQEVAHELRPLLDEELSRLPAKYRVPVVLCELEGRGRKEVARKLGVPEGTLSSRLATARKLLAERLARRGLTVTGAALGVWLSHNAASACVPASLVVSTVKAATLVAAGEAAAAGLVSAKAAALSQGVVKSMFLSKLKSGVVALAAVAFVGMAVGVFGPATAALGTSPLVVEPERDGATAAEAQGKEGDGARKKEGDAPRKKEGEEARKKDGDAPREGQKPRDGERPADKALAGKGDSVTLTGLVSKVQDKRKRDDGSEVSFTNYYLTEAKGNKVQLPAPRISEAGKALDKFNLADFVGKQVTLTGRAAPARAAEAAAAPRVVTRILQITDIREAKGR